VAGPLLAEPGGAEFGYAVSWELENKKNEDRSSEVEAYLRPVRATPIEGGVVLSLTPKMSLTVDA
jgi:hypothetical protein